MKGTDQYGHQFLAENHSWSAPGCEVLQDGQIRVGESPGLYVVTARCGEVEAQAQIRVQAKKPNGKNGDDKPAAAKVIRWSGTIPYQKWMNFYTKVVSPFASRSGFEPSGRSRSPRREG